MTRGQIKEACRLAYCSGRAKLVELCQRYRVPYDTLRTWSRLEGWSVKAVEIKAQANAGIVSEVANWLSEQRVQQIKSGVARAGKLQGAIDRLIDNELSPKDLQSLATAEERADLIIRRNLGMESQGGGGGPCVNVNVLGTVEIQG